MAKMCLQFPVTFRVYLPPTCSVNDDLMDQITLFPRMPHSAKHKLWLGSKRAALLCVEMCCICVLQRES